MKKFLAILFLVLTMCAGSLSAWDYENISVGSLYFNLDRLNLEAEVTAKPSGYYSGNIVIPTTIVYNSNTYTVIGIGERAFKGCTGMTSVVIPDGIIDIGYSAFADCSGLTSVTIPESVATLGFGATFQRCTGLRSVQWNAIRCAILENEKGDGWHYPPFYQLDNIKSFTFGEKVEVIPASVCFGLSGLAAITIPESVTVIERIAFRQCTGLTSVRIPSGVTGMGVRVLADCTGLTSITCEALVPPTLGEDAFLNVDKSIPLYVHCPSAKAYNAADQWKEFQTGCDALTATITQDCSLNGTNYSTPHPLPDTEYSLTLKAEGCNTPNTYICFDGQDAVLNAVPQEGYSFKQWDDGNTDNPRSIAVTGDMTLTALFSRDGCDLFNAALTIPEICADDDSLFISVAYTDNEPANYIVAFDSKAVAQGFQPSYKDNIRFLSSGTAQIAIPVPNNKEDQRDYVRPDVYHIDVTLYDDCDNMLTFSGQALTVHYPSWLVFQRWNDVLSLSNEEYNGNYQFSSIRWFHEGTPLVSSGDNDAYICVSPDLLVIGDAYWAELTRADDGVTMTSCPFYPVRMDDKMELGDVIEPYVTVSPQALQNGNRTFSVKTNICGTYFVYNSDGALLGRHPFCPAPDETFAIDLALYDAGSGMYVLAFQGIEGTSINVKVLVEP